MSRHRSITAARTTTITAIDADGTTTAGIAAGAITTTTTTIDRRQRPSATPAAGHSPAYIDDAECNHVTRAAARVVRRRSGCSKYRHDRPQQTHRTIPHPPLPAQTATARPARDDHTPMRMGAPDCMTMTADNSNHRHRLVRPDLHRDSARPGLRPSIATPPKFAFAPCPYRRRMIGNAARSRPY